jgi:hypothetical protein
MELTVPLYVDDNSIVPVCRFDDNCDLILSSDGCSTCDYVINAVHGRSELTGTIDSF